MHPIILPYIVVDDKVWMKSQVEKCVYIKEN